MGEKVSAPARVHASAHKIERKAGVCLNPCSTARARAHERWHIHNDAVAAADGGNVCGNIRACAAKRIKHTLDLDRTGSDTAQKKKDGANAASRAAKFVIVYLSLTR